MVRGSSHILPRAKRSMLSKYKETGGGKTLSMVSRAYADNSHHTQGTPIRQTGIGNGYSQVYSPRVVLINTHTHAHVTYNVSLS